MIQIKGFFDTNTAKARVPGAELADLRTRTDAKRADVEREDPSPDEDDSD